MALPDRQAELEHFKTAINLSAYAASLGYQIDARESSRSSVIMRCGQDKVIIAKDAATHHWVYFSVRDDNDHGTIIDFVQKRRPLTMGELRKELRPWIGQGASPAPAPERYAAHVEPSRSDQAQVQAAYGNTLPIDGHHAYLEQARAIPASVLRDPRFAGKIRRDARHNAIFPHVNADGLCGFEKKNTGFTGFASGGEKGLWASAANSQDTTLIITEGAIDALSYHALFRPPHARYLSIGGAMNPNQPKLLTRAMQRLPEGGTLVIATDNDAGGDTLTDQLTQLAKDTRPDLAITTHRPPQRGEDWNDVLKAKARSPQSQQGRGR